MKEFSLLIMMGGGRRGIESLWSTTQHQRNNHLTLFFLLMGGRRGGIELLWSASEKQSPDNLLTFFFV